MTSSVHVGFAENVVPQRGLAQPACGGDPNLLRSERHGSDVTRHDLARWKAYTLSALQVTNG